MRIGLWQLKDSDRDNTISVELLDIAFPSNLNNGASSTSAEGTPTTYGIWTSSPGIFVAVHRLKVAE